MLDVIHDCRAVRRSNQVPVYSQGWFVKLGPEVASITRAMENF